MKGTQEGFLSRQINPPQRQIAAKSRNLPQPVEKPNGFFDRLRDGFQPSFSGDFLFLRAFFQARAVK